MLFEPRENLSARQRRIHAQYELARTIVDFCAAMSFVVGSAFYFFASLTMAGTVLFLVGSVLFAVKPTLRLAREVALAREGRLEDA